MNRLNVKNFRAANCTVSGHRAECVSHTYLQAQTVQHQVYDGWTLAIVCWTVNACHFRGCYTHLGRSNAIEGTSVNFAQDCSELKSYFKSQKTPFHNCLSDSGCWRVISLLRQILLLQKPPVWYLDPNASLRTAASNWSSSRSSARPGLIGESILTSAPSLSCTTGI